MKNIKFIALKSGGYAESLRQLIRNQNNNEYLVDLLIVNAIIEARSCERFSAIAPYLEDKLNLFYSKLYKSEERHFLTYLHFAQEFSTSDIQPRIEIFLEKENKLINKKDDIFRFHSGI